MVPVPAQDIDPLLTVVTTIQYPTAEGHATGFFYASGHVDEEPGEFEKQSIYLITNRHVVADEGGDPVENSIRIFTRNSRQDVFELEYHDIDLLDEDGNPIWLEHDLGEHVDIVAIPLELPVDFDNIGTHYLSNINLKPQDVIIKPGQDAMVIGYPIKGKRPYLPISRNAMIASPYGYPFQDLHCFALDANMHSGASGSPVFTRPSAVKWTEDGGTIGGRQPYSLLGVHSSTLYSNHATAEGQLNLNRVWYAELIHDIVEKHEDDGNVPV